MATKAWTQSTPRPYEDGMAGSYLGPRFSTEVIQEFLDTSGLPYRIFEDADLGHAVAELLAEEKVVGVLQGRMEFGPRALGGRSIIGDPRSPKMQSVMTVSYTHLTLPTILLL